jgi:hypothetical protein
MKTKLFYTKLIPTHIAGCDNYFQVFRSSDIRHMADIDGNNGQIYFPETNWIKPDELAELVKLVAKIINSVK